MIPNLLVLLMLCTPYGETMKIRSIELSDADLSAELRYAIMDRRPTCGEKIAQLTRSDGTDNEIAIVPDPEPQQVVECTEASVVPLPLRDTLFTLACTVSEDDAPNPE